jgi:hypothetical protein
LVARLVDAPAPLRAGGGQLSAGALGERIHPDRVEYVVRRAQLLARVEAAALPARRHIPLSRRVMQM